MVKVEFKKYTKKEFEKYCEDEWVDSDFSGEVWKFIKDKDVHLSKINSVKGSEDEGILTIKVKLLSE